MASSGDYNWQLNTYKIITGSMRLIGAIQTGETPPAEEYEDALDALNGLVTHWQASGIHVWCELDCTLFMQPGQIRYQVGLGSPDHCTPTSGWSQSAVAVAAPRGATSLVVDDASAISAGDNLGLIYELSGMFWTQVAGAPAGNTVPLTTSLPDGIPARAIVVTYRETMVRPLRVPAARRYRFAFAGGTPVENPMGVMSRLDYGMIPNKEILGVPTQFFFDPQLGLAVIQVWPAPNTPLEAMKFTAQRPIQDFLTQRDTADLPIEWMSTLRYNLAVELAPEYDVPAERFQIVATMAQQKLLVCQTWDREPESVYFGVERFPAVRN